MNFFKIIWLNLWIEWLVLQTLIVFIIYRLTVTFNYFKLLINLLMFIIFLCIYLSFLQYELFACFLFVSEFTIIIFFYCLFLHLKQSKNINDQTSNITANVNFFIIPVILILMFLINYNNFYIISIEDLSIVWPNLYNFYSVFLLNDLVFFFYFFCKYHTSMYLLIGIILFMITLLLLYTVLVYFVSNSNKYSLLANNSSKLTVEKGFYEQTAVNTQKYFKN